MSRMLGVLLALLAIPALAQEKFRTPEAAVDALTKAAASADRTKIRHLLGPEYTEFGEGQQEADPALAKSRGQAFAAAMKEFHALSVDSDDRRTLIVGSQGWPFPLPLVRSSGSWMFDGKAGVEELRNRIIGANELNAISVLDYYVSAQRQYAEDDMDGDGAVEYAQKFTSSQGKHDGLYWEDAEDDPNGMKSPLGPLIALAEATVGEQRKGGEPFLGYRYRILTGQGASAKAGAYDYVINGHMVAGFGAVAWPSGYGDTGVMSFVVNQDGVIYQRDLGEDTESAAAKITKFDPGEGWAAVDDDNVLGEGTAAAD